MERKVRGWLMVILLPAGYVWMNSVASRCCNSLSKKCSYSALKIFPNNIVKMCECLLTQHCFWELLQFPRSHHGDSYNFVESRNWLKSFIHISFWTVPMFVQGFFSVSFWAENTWPQQSVAAVLGKWAILALPTCRALPPGFSIYRQWLKAITIISCIVAGSKNSRQESGLIAMGVEQVQLGSPAPEDLRTLDYNHLQAYVSRACGDLSCGTYKHVRSNLRKQHKGIFPWNHSCAKA